jgi:RNA polymerase sigma-70 factor (ECF subfamily)
MPSGTGEVAALVARAKAGDREAVGELTSRFRPEVEHFLARLAPGASEDLAQKVFINLSRSLRGYEESDRFAAWLRTVAYNTFRTWSRSEIRRGLDTLHTNVGAVDSSTTSLFGTAKQVLRDLVPELPEGEREAWELYAKGLPPREIAAELGISASAAATRVSRAKDRLTALVLEALGKPQPPS